jgi:hypothetical protein
MKTGVGKYVKSFGQEKVLSSRLKFCDIGTKTRDVFVRQVISLCFE